MNVSKDIWQRRGGDELTTRIYALSLGGFFVWTVLLVGLMAWLSYGWGAYFLISLMGFVGAMIGIGIYSSSEEVGSSFMGVSLLAGSLGVMVGPVLAYYSAETMVVALMITFGVTIGMVIMGMLMPNLIQKAAGVLMVGLLILLVGYMVQWILLLVGIFPRLGALDWLAAILFSLYIWYDWARAMKLPKTVNNAIDAAGALIVDVVNLFMVLLRLVGRSQR